LRFPGFEGSWEFKRLSELGYFFSGGTPKTTNKNYYDGHISFIRSGEIKSDITELRISEDALKNSSAKMVYKGDILIAIYGATSGDIAISKISGAINQAILCFDTKVNNQFFKNLWQKHVEIILETYLQGGQGNLSAEIVKNLKFYFPMKVEQKKIALFFENIEEKIETQRKTIEQLNSQIELLVNLFMEEKLKLNSTNKKWKTFKISEIGETFNGLSGKGKEDFGSGKRYIQYKQIFDSRKIDINECGFVEILENENQNKVKFGDAFFTISSETPNEIGMSSVLLNEVDNIYLNSFCFGFRIFSHSLLNPKFASFFFRSKVFRNSIVKLAQGSTRYNMSKNEFLKLKINLPTESEQVKISEILERLSEKLETEKKILELLELQKKYFLQNLFV